MHLGLLPFDHALTLDETLHDGEEWQKSLDDYMRQGSFKKASAFIAEIQSNNNESENLLRACLILNAQARVHSAQGKYSDALENLRHCTSLAERIDNHSSMGAVAIHSIAKVKFELGDFDDAAHLGREAVTQFEQSGNKLGQAAALNTVARCMFMIGEDHYQRAMHIVDEAFSIAQTGNETDGKVACLHTMVVINLRIPGHERKALELTEQIMPLLRSLPGEAEEAWNCMSRRYRLGAALLLKSHAALAIDPQQSEQAATEALELYEDLRDNAGQSRALQALAMAQLSSSKVEDAVQSAYASVDLAENHDSKLLQAEAMHVTGMALQASIAHAAQHEGSQFQIRHEEKTLAARMFLDAIKLFREVGNESREAFSRHELVKLYLYCGMLAEAALEVKTSQTLTGQLGDPSKIADALLMHALAVNRSGDIKKGLRVARDGQKICRDMGNDEAVASFDDLLCEMRKEARQEQNDLAPDNMPKTTATRDCTRLLAFSFAASKAAGERIFDMPDIEQLKVILEVKGVG